MATFPELAQRVEGFLRGQEFFGDNSKTQILKLPEDRRAVLVITPDNKTYVIPLLDVVKGKLEAELPRYWENSNNTTLEYKDPFFNMETVPVFEIPSDQRDGVAELFGLEHLPSFEEL